MAALHVTRETWQREVIESPTPVLVDFWAPWCAPCRMIGPAIDSLAREFEGRVKVAKLNVDDDPELAGAHGVTSIPALLIFRGGRVVDQRLGAASLPALQGFVAPHAGGVETAAQA